MRRSILIIPTALSASKKFQSLIADDMGLGKTLQTLIFIGGLKKFYMLTAKKLLRGNFFGEVISLHGKDLRKFFMNDRTPLGRKIAAECFGTDDLRNF